MSDYTPTQFTNGTQTKTAYSPSDEVRFRFDGWWEVGEVPPDNVYKDVKTVAGLYGDVSAADLADALEVELGDAGSASDAAVADRVTNGTLTGPAILAKVGDVTAASDSAVATRVASGSATGAALDSRIGQYKVWAKNPDNLVAGSLTYDTAGRLTSAVVEWPDGKPGVLTIDGRQASTDAVTAYHITHVDGVVTKTYTQPTITRDSSGNATAVPQITVA